MPIEVPTTLVYSRSVLNEAKLGKGKGLKKLRESIQDNPNLRRQFYADRAIEQENNKQRQKMMWVFDANSRVRRVQNSFRELCTFTNPIGTGVVPCHVAVEKGKMASLKREFNKESLPKMSLM